MGQIIDISSVVLELGLSSSITDEERAIVSTAITRAEGAVKRYLQYNPCLLTRTEYYPQQDYFQQSGGIVWETTDTQAYERRVAVGSSTQLQVQHIPIRSVTTLHIDYDGRAGDIAGSFAAASLQTLGTNYWMNNDGLDSDGNNICRDGIIHSEGLWPTTPGNIRIVYVAGYSKAEIHGQDTLIDASPLMDAIIEESSRRVRKAMVWKKKTNVGFTAGPFVSETLGDYKYSTGSGDSKLVDRMFGGLYDLLPETKEKLADFVNYGWALS